MLTARKLRNTAIQVDDVGTSTTYNKTLKLSPANDLLCSVCFYKLGNGIKVGI